VGAAYVLLRHHGVLLFCLILEFNSGILSIAVLVPLLLQPQFYTVIGLRGL
jgi:hypothetical protein